MESATPLTTGQLLKQFEEIVKKLLQRIDEEFQPEDKSGLDHLFDTHIKSRHVFSKYFILNQEIHFINEH